MLSAHGSAPEVVAAARARGSYVVDSVCPLVTKVHHEVKVRAGKGYRIVYVGHEGHEEAVGTMAVAPDVDQPRRVGRRGRRARRVRPSRSRCSPRPRCRTATGATSPSRSRERFPDAWTPGRSDLCFATTNRQSALMAIGAALRRDRGDRLGQLVEHPGAGEAGRARPAARSVFRVNDRRRAPRRSSPGTSSASPPARRRPRSWSTRSSSASPRRTASSWCGVTDEDEYFPPPRNLRDLQARDRGGRHGDARRRVRRLPARSTTAASAPATCSPASPSADHTRPSVGDDAPPPPPPLSAVGRRWRERWAPPRSQQFSRPPPGSSSGLGRRLRPRGSRRRRTPVRSRRPRTRGSPRRPGPGGRVRTCRRPHVRSGVGTSRPPDCSPG